MFLAWFGGIGDQICDQSRHCATRSAASIVASGKSLALKAGDSGGSGPFGTEIRERSGAGGYSRDCRRARLQSRFECVSPVETSWGNRHHCLLPSSFENTLFGCSGLPAFLLAAGECYSPHGA